MEGLGIGGGGGRTAGGDGKIAVAVPEVGDDLSSANKYKKNWRVYCKARNGKPPHRHGASRKKNRGAAEPNGV